MSDFLIRADLSEKVLRSVGAEPNGIVCIVAPEEGASWAIDASWQPPQIDEIPGGGVVSVEMPSEGGLGPASSVVDADDMVAACATEVEAGGLLQLVVAATTGAMQRCLPRLEFEVVQSHLVLALATRDALQRHGYLTRSADA